MSDTLLGVAKHGFRNKPACKFFEVFISGIKIATSFRLRRMILCRKLCSLCHSGLPLVRCIRNVNYGAQSRRSIGAINYVVTT